MPPRERAAAEHTQATEPRVQVALVLMYTRGVRIIHRDRCEWCLGNYPFRSSAHRLMRSHRVTVWHMLSEYPSDSPPERLHPFPGSRLPCRKRHQTTIRKARD